MTRALVLALAVLGAAAAACTTGDVASPETASAEAPVRPSDPDQPRPASSGIGAIAAQPKNVADLFAARILPTCALNGGVCHNSNHYPDLRDLSSLADLVDLPCGMNVDEDLPDACEPQGDHLVADGGVDVTIVRATFDAASATTTITTDSAVSIGPLTHARVRRVLARGEWIFDAASRGVIVEATASTTLLVRLANASDDAREFFTPSLPLREEHVWPADPNRNGILGASLGWREIRPGHPDRSWIVARLWDTRASPELMPRQCREWDDVATRALGCWIEGLKVDASGAVTNFSDEIDYARCKFEVDRPGRCGSGISR